jgi:ribose transport system substrate-binding protein
MMGYAAVSAMARIFAGQDPSKQDSGIGIQVCDKEHNLPPKGQPFTAGIEYIPAYEEMWGLK